MPMRSQVAADIHAIFKAPNQDEAEHLLEKFLTRYENTAPQLVAVQAILEIHLCYGFGKLFKTLRRQGYRWNHKRVYRVYCLLKLNRRRKGKQRLPSRHPDPLTVPPTANCCWSVDFMSDTLMCGRRFRTFNVVDDFKS